MHPTSAASPDFVSPPVPAALSAGWLQGTPGRRVVALIWFAMLYAVLQVYSFKQRSATYDEPLHLAAGYAAVARQDYRYDFTHPPLARMWAALPLLGTEGINFDPKRIDRLDPPGWAAQMYEDAHGLLFSSPDPDAVLSRARCMNVLLGIALGGILFCWVEAWLGFAPAVLVLLFQLLSPNLGAHATLVTTDMAVTLLFLGTIFFLWRLCTRFSAGNIAGLALCFGAALASKFSAVLLVPIGGLLLAFAVWRVEAMTWRRAAGLAVILAVTAWLVIWATYGFRYAPSDTPGWLLRIHDLPMVHERLPVLGPVLRWIDDHHLLPNAYAQGFLLSFSTSEIQPSYLAGQVSFTGWWYYFPVAFLIKTPISLLILGGSGVLFMLFRARQLGAGTVVFLLLPPAIFLGVAMTTGINIGIRHILPVYPFALLIAAAGFHQIVAARWRDRTKWVVLGTLGAQWVGMYAAVYPFTLTFFNAAVGGPGQGHRFLADSNLDWGQHLKVLKKWMEERGIEHINLAYFGMGSPKYNGINCTLLPGVRDFFEQRVAKPVLPGYVAIGATVASGAYLPPEWRAFYAGFAHETPVALLGNSLRVYWVDKWPEGEPPRNDDEAVAHTRLADGLHELGWHDHALRHYDAVLTRNPDDSQVLARRGLVLFDIGRNDEAAAAFQQAIALAPGKPQFRDLYVTALIRRQRFREAIGQGRELVALVPHASRAHDLLGIALAGNGQLTAAAEEFRRAVELDPANTAARDHLEMATRQRQRPRL